MYYRLRLYSVSPPSERDLAAAVVVTATAAAVTATATTAVAGTAHEAVVAPTATAAEQQDENDDPPAATETIVIAHIEDLLKFFLEHLAHSMLCQNEDLVTAYGKVSEKRVCCNDLQQTLIFIV